jgi:hypothetical protein
VCHLILCVVVCEAQRWGNPFLTRGAFGDKSSEKKNVHHHAFVSAIALRELTQSFARDLGPKGRHVAWINVDGVIDIPGRRERYAQMKDEDLLKPAAIAETYWHLAHQDRSAWTLELEVRLFKEKF